MPRLIALGAIGVTRNNVTVYPEIGTQESGVPFDFTDDEVKAIRETEKLLDTVLLRKPRNEDTAQPASAPAAPTNLDKSGAGAAADLAAVKTFTTDNTGAELKAEADRRGLDYSKLKTKADLVALLDANPAKVEGDESNEESDADEDL